MKPQKSSFTRLVRSSPMLAAIIYHGVCFERWLVTAFTVSCLMLLLFQKERQSLDLRSIVVVLILGVSASLIPAGYVPIIGVLPPLIGLILLNVLIAFGVVVAVCDFSVAKWLIGWGIIGLSIGENNTISAVYPLSCFLLLQLLFAASEAGLFEMGRRSLGIYMVVTGLVAIIAFEFGNLTRAAQAVIQDALGDYYDTYSVNGISGISDELFVASRGALTASRSPVLELSTPVERLRTKVFDQFDGARWLTSSAMQKPCFRARQAELTEAAEVKDLSLIWLDEPKKVIPTPAGTVRVQQEPVVIQCGGIYTTEIPMTEIDLAFNSLEVLPSESIHSDLLLEVPDALEEPLKIFSQNFFDEDVDALAKSKKLELYFKNNFSYSLETGFNGRDHPIVQMLKPGTRAYCVYFASAMALVLRSEGVPCRVVSGYLPVKKNTITQKVTVRKCDAHAWVEVWNSIDQRFDIFDPTPISSRNEVLGFSKEIDSVTLDAFRAIWSSVRLMWIRSQRHPSTFIQAVFLSREFLTLAFALIVLTMVRFKLGRLKIRADKDLLVSTNQQVLTAYQYYEASLRKRGIRLGFGETDFVAIEYFLENGDIQTAELAEEFLQLYRETRYGDRPFNERLLGLAKKIGDD
ncbi:MAG: transglutaminase-like domain-containing protein [Planctomycetota bacterium]|nr:transglutaminase-like domain-containing protein [Planctomycetota bacterium]